MTIITADTRAIYYEAHGAETVNGVTPVSASTGISEALTAVSSDNENAFLGMVDAANLAPLPSAGALLGAGDLYADGDRAVMVRKSHARTEHAVDDLVPTLFLVHRENVDGVEWVAGESVVIGTIRIYDGVTYRALQSHVTQSDWTPPNVPALWEQYTEPTDEWQAGVSYAIGDIVTYDGTEYECIQAHTSQVGWEPPNVPALWSAL